MQFAHNNFISKAFHWFTGVVEDINDPLEMGRVRVRCYGYHTESKEDPREGGQGIPTGDLPWAHVMMPITSASISGIGESATGVLPGSWVVGFFRDGQACQDPVVMGTIPSATPAPKDPINTGFCDPSGENPRESDDIDNPKGSRADYEESNSYILKSELRELSKVDPKEGEKERGNIPTAIPPNTSILSDNKPESFFDRGSWIQPDQEDICAPLYPECHVKEYKSGHTIEVDDTGGHERITILHKSGTFDEIDSLGDKTTVVVGDGYEVTFKDKNVNVKGNCNLTIDGDVRTYIRGNYFMEVEKDYHLNILGSVHKKVGGSEFIEVNVDRNDNINKNVTTRIGENERRTVNGNSNLEIIKNYEKTVTGNLTELITGTESKTTIGAASISGGGAMTMVASGNIKIDTSGAIDIDAQTDVDITCPADIDINGGTINLN